MGGDTPRVEVARAALCEIGRHDLAAQVYPNRAGHPSFNPPCAVGPDHPRPSPADAALVARAFWLGHLADPDGLPHLVAFPPSPTLGGRDR